MVYPLIVGSCIAILDIATIATHHVMVPDPYMVRSTRSEDRTKCQRNHFSSTRYQIQMMQDEPFHDEQTRKYCAGDWGELLEMILYSAVLAQSYDINPRSYFAIAGAWNPKITTFPGSYIAPAMLGTAARVLGGTALSELTCSTTALRVASAVWSAIAFIIADLLVLRMTVWTVDRRIQADNASATSLVAVPAALLLWPTQHFFATLVYTDAASTCSVLLCWFLAFRQERDGNSLLAGVPGALAGAVAISMRQTNSIWVALAAGMLLCRLHW